MRHLNAGRKLSRKPAHRRALLRNLVTSFLEHERLVTTLPKAKELRPLAEKMITLGKHDTLHSRRQVQAYVLKEAVAKRVFDTIAPRFAARQGGYSRIVKLGNRKGDGADVAVIELIGSDLAAKKAQKEAAAKATDKKSKGKEPEAKDEKQ